MGIALPLVAGALAVLAAIISGLACHGICYRAEKVTKVLKARQNWGP